MRPEILLSPVLHSHDGDSYINSVDSRAFELHTSLGRRSKEELDRPSSRNLFHINLFVVEHFDNGYMTAQFRRDGSMGRFITRKRRSWGRSRSL